MTSIGKKLLSVYESVQKVTKDLTIKMRSGSYKVLSEKMVLGAIRPELVKNKLIIVQTGAQGDKTGNITRVNTKYQIIDTESSEFIEMAGYGEGSDSQDKGAGMAQTYALKNALMKTFMLISGDDSDNVSSDDKDDEFQEQLMNAEKQCTKLLGEAIAKNLINESVSSLYAKDILKNRKDINGLRKIYKEIKSYKKIAPKDGFTDESIPDINPNNGEAIY